MRLRSKVSSPLCAALGSLFPAFELFVFLFMFRFSSICFRGTRALLTPAVLLSHDTLHTYILFGLSSLGGHVEAEGMDGWALGFVMRRSGGARG